MSAPDLPLILEWEDFLVWFLPALEKLPKSVRFTLTTRLQGLALDVLDGLVQARFRRDRLVLLEETNLRLERMRTLLRVAHRVGRLPATTYRNASERLDASGRQLGGWIRAELRSAATERTTCAESAPSSTG